MTEAATPLPLFSGNAARLADPIRAAGAAYADRMGVRVAAFVYNVTTRTIKRWQEAARRNK